MYKTTHNNGGHSCTHILDGEGYMWFTGYTTSGAWPIGSPGYTGTHHIGSFRREGHFINGDIDFFWWGGDENKW